MRKIKVSPLPRIKRDRMFLGIKAEAEDRRSLNLLGDKRILNSCNSQEESECRKLFIIFHNFLLCIELAEYLSMANPRQRAF
jgi:hypothetical protein